MKIQPIILATCLTITATAGLYQGDGDKKAEDVYKNIKVLKGMPASQVIPSMKFMCASLKVDCEYCHKEDDFASDAVEGKEAARHMIEMQNDINAKNFRGRTQVTCNSCHNGSTHPNSVPSLPGVSRRTIDRQAATATPADVLKKYQKAVGDGLKSVEFDGTATGFGPEGPVKVTQGGAGEFVMEMGGRKFGYDGTATWVQVGSGAAQALPAEQATEVQKFGQFFRGEHAFDSFGELRFAGRDKIDGKEVIVLRTASRTAKTSADLYFDSSTGLLTRLATYTTTPLGSIPESVEFGDYRKVGGAMVPFMITRPGGKAPIVMKFAKATANPKLADKFFSIPPK
ncbi:MAG: c-type cytochrome [Armatimonadetes bacterium]|nr:c-type cytochrome [Armatimonadota bacterium]